MNTSSTVVGFGTWIVPSVGFGTFNSFENHQKVYHAVKHAIKTGYRMFDCAALYENEKEVGAAINECIADGIVKRSDLCIMSKLWNTDHAPEDVELAILRSLQKMGLEYFDVFMMHWPVHMDAKLVSIKDGGQYKLKIHHSM